MLHGIRCLLLVEVLATGVAASHAQTRMFKCITDGRTIYQQSACANAAPADAAVPVAQAASARRLADVRTPAKPTRPAASAAAGKDVPRR